jgi:hypothetical protein
MGHMHVRRIWFALLFGALFSFYFGGSVVPYLVLQVFPWLWWWFVVLVSHLLTFIVAKPPAALPWPWSYLLAPNFLLGGIWVLYYTLAYRSSQKWSRSSFGGGYTRITYDYQYNIYSLHGPEEPPVLSPAFEGEQRSQIVERCYEEYRKALLRYNPPPVPELKTPPTFFYRPGNKLVWQVTTAGTLLPTIPDELLTPENIPLLLPLLAQHLAWYQTDDFQLRRAFDRYADEVSFWFPTSLLVWTGNFVWLPVLAKDQGSWQSWLINRVYEADRFAVWLGQGPALEHLLRLFEAELKRRGQVDRSVPTLASRIAQLEVLNNKEREEMHKLGLKPIEPPLIKGKLRIPQQLQPNTEHNPLQSWY